MASWLMRLPSKSYSVHFILGLILTYFYFNYRFHVPVVMYVLLSLHNLLLVVNSSVNFIIYCCVGKRFRQELKLMLTPYCNFVCHCICNDQKDQADAEDPVPCQFWSLLNENEIYVLIPPLHVITKFQKYIPILMTVGSWSTCWVLKSKVFGQKNLNHITWNCCLLWNDILNVRASKSAKHTFFVCQILMLNNQSHATRHSISCIQDMTP